MAKKGELNERQQRFADEYILSGVAYSSALKAGYSEAYAKTNSHKLLENGRIRAYIDERMSELKSTKIADQQEIMEFLTSIMRGEVAEPVAVLDGDGYQKIVEVKPSAQSRKSAAELLGKRYAMWTDKKDIDGDISINIAVDYGDDNE